MWHRSRRSSTKPQPTHPGRTPHAVGHGLILLMMGIMMPEKYWDRKFDNKHRISCILLVLSLHLKFTMHGHKNPKFGLLYLLLVPIILKYTISYPSESKGAEALTCVLYSWLLLSRHFPRHFSVTTLYIHSSCPATRMTLNLSSITILSDLHRLRSSCYIMSLILHLIRPSKNGIFSSAVCPQTLAN